MQRRKFLNLIPAGAFIASNPTSLIGQTVSGNSKKLTILHTNDWHSRIDPFPMDGSRNQGLGGAAKRAALVNIIRNENPNVLLFDCGDIFQGTPYFNYFGGELEFKLMSKMGYDVATIGNHDFDGGIDNLAAQMQHASFSMVNSNYSFSNTPLADKIPAYKIIVKDGIKIGVYGLGIELEGLVGKSLYGNTFYKDPLKEALKIEEYLRNKEGCDLIICLSHLGYKYENNKVSDVVIAQNTMETDIILGGHTHTFMKEADRVLNKQGNEVVINQVGWAGILLGRIDVSFDSKRCFKCSTSKNKVV